MIDNLILINKENGLNKDYVPNDLVICDNNENNFHGFLDSRVKPMIKNEYGQYLLKVIEEKKQELDSDTFRNQDIDE